MIVRFYINKLTRINSIVTIEVNVILPNGRLDLIYPVGTFGLYEALAFQIIFSSLADLSKTFLPTGVKLVFFSLSGTSWSPVLPLLSHWDVTNTAVIVV